MGAEEGHDIDCDRLRRRPEYLYPEMWLPFLASPSFARAIYLCHRRICKVGRETTFDLLFEKGVNKLVIPEIREGGYRKIGEDHRLVQSLGRLSPTGKYTCVFNIHFHYNTSGLVVPSESDLSSIVPAQPITAVAVASEATQPRLMLLGIRGPREEATQEDIAKFGSRQVGIVQKLIGDYEVVMLDWSIQGKKAIPAFQEVPQHAMRLPRVKCFYSPADLWLNPNLFE